MKAISLIAIVLAFEASAVLPNNYQALRADEKQAILWNQVEKGRYTQLPPVLSGGWGTLLNKLKNFVTLGETFNKFTDELPPSRKDNKFLHGSGSVAKVTFVPVANSPYTGVFKTGAIGLARMSLAGNPKDLESYTPGIALKLLADGIPSLNVVAMYSLNGQGDNHNFYANNFTTLIPEPKGFSLGLVKKWFDLFVDDPLHVSTWHFASYDNTGKKVDNPKNPYFITFVPVQKNLIAENSQDDFRNDLKKSVVGEVLYRVYASETKTSSLKLIGDLVLNSEFVASEYGDHKLFFQHRD